MSKQEKADLAFELYSHILEAKNAETNRVIFLGHLFKRIRDEKLYKCLDNSVENFNEFVACPEIGYQRATVYSYIRIYEKFVEELNYDVAYLSEIGHKRLQLILPHVDGDPEEWLSRAKTWSYKDLINETRKKEKRPPMKHVEETDTSEKHIEEKNYLEYVKNHSCIFHSKRKSEKAHFPRTDKRGAPDWHVIPLCGVCHHMLHDMGVISFWGQYRNQICGFYYATIFKLFEEVIK